MDKKTERRTQPSRTHSYGSSPAPAYDPQRMAAARRRRQAKRKRAIRNRIIFGVLVLAVLVGVVLLVVSLVKGRADTGGASQPAGTATSLPQQEDPMQEEANTPAGVDISQYKYFEEGIPLLVNKQNSIPEGLSDAVETAEVGVRPDTGVMQQLEKNAARAFLDMVEAAEADGIELWPVSGYRSHSHQVSNYNARVQQHINEGYGQAEAEQKAGEIIAVPGTSEHEIGLAIDINSLETTFENTEAFAWLQKHCNEYGFILRYEKDTYDETGITYEPWHYRYVGDNHAKAIAEQNVTLEAYVAMMQESNQLG